MIFVVLEDMQARVDWLRGAFPKAEIIWHTNATDFVECLKSGVKPTLVFFDHDLDTADPNRQPGQLHGADGLTGEDAARMMPEVDCSAIIWSANPVGARSIARALMSKVSGRIFVSPFTTDKELLRSSIIRALEQRPSLSVFGDVVHAYKVTGRGM